MLVTFFILALLSGILSYASLDPLKSSFFLIMALLFSMPLVSFGNHVWFSYFICLLFLSGIFVIMVYFASLSSLVVMKGYLYALCFLLSLFLGCNINYVVDHLNLNTIYYSTYFWLLFVVLSSLIFFMNFCSYFLHFSGALRKV